MELEEIIKLTEVIEKQNELIAKLTIENAEQASFIEALLEK